MTTMARTSKMSPPRQRGSGPAGDMSESSRSLENPGSRTASKNPSPKLKDLAVRRFFIIFRGPQALNVRVEERLSSPCGAGPVSQGGPYQPARRKRREALWRVARSLPLVSLEPARGDASAFADIRVRPGQQRRSPKFGI